MLKVMNNDGRTLLAFLFLILKLCVFLLDISFRVFGALLRHLGNYLLGLRGRCGVLGGGLRSCGDILLEELQLLVDGLLLHSNIFKLFEII